MDQTSALTRLKYRAKAHLDPGGHIAGSKTTTTLQGKKSAYTNTWTFHPVVTTEQFRITATLLALMPH